MARIFMSLKYCFSTVQMLRNSGSIINCNWSSRHSHSPINYSGHSYAYMYTVKPPIKDTPIDKPPNKGQAESTRVYSVENQL